MNLSSRTAAGRSRSADEGAFLRLNVGHTTGPEPSAQPAASAHAWKRVLQERIWSQHGPKGLAARSVLLLLIWHADASGRTWLGIQTIASKIGAGSQRTVRNALDTLVRDGWLKSTPQTWATLTAEQSAAGRPTPRRGDVGQAPNLYVVLDGHGNPVTFDAVTTSTTVPRPGLARVTSFDLKQVMRGGPGQKSQGSPGQNEQGEPLADLHDDLDPKGSPSRIASAERALRVRQSTHHFIKVSDDDGWLTTWSIIVETHTAKTKAVYSLPPLPPDLKREQQKVLADSLNGAATEVCAKLRERTDIERDEHDVRRELAARVMQLYFKRDNEHLRRVKHALRDLPREFHARLTEAMQLILRESHDATKPRQTHADEKFVKTITPAERAPARQTGEAAQVITAREARRLLDVLGAAPKPEEPSIRPSREHQQTMPTSNAGIEANDDCPERTRRDKPQVQDKPAVSADVTAPAGAPRWGNVGPRPTKVRTISKPRPDDVGVGEVLPREARHGAVSPTLHAASPTRTYDASTY